MINRKDWGFLYFEARGEILRFSKDKQKRKQYIKGFFINQDRKLGDRR